ncbi:inositol-tetrakisphosphate 1-kinase [Anaeramoeba flamelloides]|uniref:Inositol-tetrakisphosphate 1-kinase n=1 Tax=Anaeramoeba flamelloides TaxID=1746091 RepID=A0AAV7ZE31_9EUKA|nr:inositol-tetrakisphosphate 1-kinase [Anaeramoeba flamelloides]KAJ6244100.1 inositol-tetrakisphosphate 1-kinase [Anaeramoeba flamelloides]
MSIIGYILPDSKCTKMKWDELIEIGKNYSLDFRKINLEKPLDEQGSFDLLLHKLTYQYSKSKYESNEKAALEIDKIIEYTKRHPKMIVVDPIASVEILIDRKRTSQVLEGIVVPEEMPLQIPKHLFVESSEEAIKLMKERTNEISFPVICKPTEACGLKRTHFLEIAFNFDGLSKVSSFPCIIEPYYNHHQTVYKIYCLGDRVYITSKRSSCDFNLQNLDNLGNIWFDSQKPMPEKLCGDTNVPLRELPKESFVKEIAKLINQAFEGLELFGFDLVFDQKNQKYAIVDLNYFSDYKNIPQFHNHFCQFFKGKLNQN